MTTLFDGVQIEEVPRNYHTDIQYVQLIHFTGTCQYICFNPDSYYEYFIS